MKFALILLLLAVAAHAAEPLLIETTLVDGEVIGFGTFQSHNQKVVRNRRGIFMTHLRSRNEKYTAQQWRLSRSEDGGRTFRTIYEATDATNPPVLETDAADNIYLGRPDFVSLEVLVYRFLAAEDYREPHITRIAKGAAGKYSMALDEARKEVCYFSHSGTFHRVGFDGAERSSVTLLKRGLNAVQQYPQLQFAPDGTLHAAWTTEKIGAYLYWDIHYMQSPDGGGAWRTMGGAPITAPVVADDGGPTDRITLDDEFEVHTWLSSFFIKDGKAHFLYLAQSTPQKQHYVRYDLRTARRELDIQPEFKGRTLSMRGLDGFFASRAGDPKSTLYCIGQDAGKPRLVCLASDDNGATWRDHAVSETFTRPYAIGGCREVTPDGWIIGSFTEKTDTKSTNAPEGRVYFFRIATQPTASKAGAAKSEKP
ncbi:MAG: BNR-4 repeat-containing protein [Verrucomicrobia bacterium]|nr:BNR-4 repeat-containing protein [Verrucomicrobiota bacterium]